MKKFPLFLLLSILLIQFSTVFAKDNSRISDPVTYDTYQEELREKNSSSKLSGKVWTDKSVIANNGENNTGLKIDGKTINFDDNFLEIYSALGSNSEIGETTKAPIDLVMTLDLSRSMMEPLVDGSEVDSTLGRQKTKLDEMVSALNDVFNKVTEANTENKIGLILFAKNAETIIPLDNISKLSDKPFIEVTKLESSDDIDGPNVNITVNYRDSKGETVKREFERINDTLGTLTNFEAAYCESFKTFSDNKTDSRLSNKPKLVMLSDGVYTACYQNFFKYDDKEVYNAKTTNSDVILPLITLLNSVYLKAKANQVYHYPVEVINLVSNYSDNSDNITKIEALTNKDNYLLSSTKLEGDSVLAKCQDIFQKWKNGKYDDLNVKYENLDIEALPEDVTMDEFIKTLNFIDSIEEVPITEQSNVLKDMVSTFLNNDFKPVDDTATNKLNDTGAVSYHETIGDYMQVNLKQMILFSKTYDFKKVDTTLRDGITTDTYIPVSQSGFIEEVKNNTYTKPTSFKLSEIKVELVTKQDGNQELNISIPSNALPVFKTTVEYEQNYEQDSERKVKSVYDNRNSSDSSPIRFIYGVNLRKEIVNDDNTINLDEIDPDYLSKHQQGEKVEFFTTKYDDGQDNTYNAESNFIPAMENPYYIAQDDYPIYSDYSSVENSVRHVLDNRGQLNGASNYYIEKPFYCSTGSKYLKDKNIDCLSGQDLLNNSNSLAEEGNNLILKKGNNYIGNLGNYQIFKRNNLTKTSDLRILPNIDTTQERPEVVNYLGNNGKCALTVREIKLLITKYHSIGENLLTKDSLTVNAGSIITYALEVSNPTSSDVNNATVSDALPKGLQLINNSITDNGRVSNGTIYWTIDVPANSTVTLKFQAVVIDNSINTFENNFIIDYENEHGTHSETSNTVVEKLVYPDLSLEKYQAEEGQIPNTNTIRYVKGGDKLVNYQFKVINHGTGTAKDVYVYDDVPTDFRILNETITDNGTALNNRVSWKIDHLDPGESKIVGFNVIIPKETAAKSWVNTSFVTHSTDPNPRQSNNVIIEKAEGNLSIRKSQATSQNPTPTYNQLIVAPGDTVTYYIDVTNNGDLTENNITVTDPIPEGLEIINGSISNNGTLQNNQIVWSIPSLGAGANSTLSFSVKVPKVSQVNEWRNLAQLDQEGLPTTYSNTVVVNEPDSIETVSLTDDTPKTNVITNKFSPVNDSIENNNYQDNYSENRENPRTGINSFPLSIVATICIISILGYMYCKNKS